MVNGDGVSKRDEGLREGSFDLHAHTVFSDGTKTVEELIEQARSAGLGGIAVTDHDTLATLSTVRKLSRAMDFPVLAGTEVSTFDPVTGRKVHILAYGLEETEDGSSPLELMLADTLEQRTMSSLWIAWQLKLRGAAFGGIPLSLEEVFRVSSPSTALYRQHIMTALTHLPSNAPAYRDAARRLLKETGLQSAHPIRYPEAPRAVSAIREQGGVPVLAHPGQKDSWESIPSLVDAGLMGIEAFHPDHGPEERRMAFEAAERYGLFVTGGSDYHGDNGKAPCMGTDFVTPTEAGEAVLSLFDREAGLS